MEHLPDSCPTGNKEIGKTAITRFNSKYFENIIFSKTEFKQKKGVMMENEDISDILPLKLFYFSPTYFILLFYGVLNEKKN